MGKIESNFEAHAEAADGADGIRALKIGKFSRFYADVLFAHFDKDSSGSLQLAEVQEALKYLVKPEADGTKVTPVISFPAQYTSESGEVSLPPSYFWTIFASFD